MPFISPRYQSAKTAELARPPSADPNNKKGHYRKFRIPPKAKQHIQERLEDEGIATSKD
eukprot:CAMPEP_0113951368 /NCGR_PEP_ID=MMETSP1339-20121228/85797_1 /TAXON_ID=94617 /ORGANISM="Fibrocapsa japonica" /LENGTH=58 /DNA_ID=CAMNT_0000959595 /DNA_START=54 /DNA_END=230 /DNA_ORIENTATION=+ /assembly_acc=CAM_ASM_000762